MKQKTVIIFGGTGFVGAQIVEKLAREGAVVRIASRAPKSAYYLRPCGYPAQVEPVFCDYSEKSIDALISKADFVVNCVGILHETRKSKFDTVHNVLPACMSKICAKHNIASFIHISALAVDQAKSNYARSKMAGEQTILENFPDAVILRPSVIFGPKDSFFNMFSRLSRYLPFLPLIGGGKTLFQPVYVGDIARAVVAVIKNRNSRGRVYELGGPDVVSFKEIYQLLAEYTGRKRLLLSIPFGLAKIQAFFMALMPKPLLTRDQVESLKTDNVVSKDALTFKDLTIDATPMKAVLPRYL